jgi:negative regulator of sigma E activity
MTTPHLSPEQAAQWVTGLLEGPAAAALEAHVADCSQCTRLLQAEARIEVALQQATQPEARPRTPWRRLAAPLAAAAAAVIVASWGLSTSGERSGADAGTTSPSLQAFKVPRYEGTTVHAILTAPAPL